MSKQRASPPDLHTRSPNQLAKRSRLKQKVPRSANTGDESMCARTVGAREYVSIKEEEINARTVEEVRSVSIRE